MDGADNQRHPFLQHLCFCWLSEIREGSSAAGQKVAAEDGKCSMPIFAIPGATPVLPSLSILLFPR